MKIINAEEAFEISRLHWQGDTLVIPMHIFDTKIRSVVESGRMNGVWVKNYGDAYALTFSTSRHNYHFSLLLACLAST